MADLGVDDEGCAATSRRAKHPHHFSCHGALQIVGHQNHARLRAEASDTIENLLLQRPRRVGIVLVIDASHLLVSFGHYPDFLDRRSRRILDETLGSDGGVRQQAAQRRTGRIAADDADEHDRRAEGGQIVRDVGGPAEPRVLGLEAHNGDRCLGRDARDAPHDEAVQHDVADDENGLAGEAVDEIARARGRERRQGHARACTAGREAAKGNVTTIRNSMRNSESPKLYSNRPATSIAMTAASPAAASTRCVPLRN